MSVLVKGMEMPKNCGDCFALDDYGDYPRCLITQEQQGYTFNIRQYKMDKCPLVEVPTPHGRLIDADALEDNSITYYATPVLGDRVDMVMRLEDLDAAPTIIPADNDSAMRKESGE